MEDQVTETRSRGDVIATAAVPAALAMLKNIDAAISGAGNGLPVAAFSIDEIMASAREIYASACTPANTMLITQAVEHVLRDPIRQRDPEIWAFCANVCAWDSLAA